VQYKESACKNIDGCEGWAQVRSVKLEDYAGYDKLNCRLHRVQQVRVLPGY
jgi:hypothetical protein